MAVGPGTGLAGAARTALVATAAVSIELALSFARRDVVLVIALVGYCAASDERGQEREAERGAQSTNHGKNLRN